MQITGTIRIGEANAACRKIGARQRGSVLWILVPSIVLGFGVFFFADLVQTWVNFDIGLPYWIVILCVVYPAFIFVVRKFSIWRFRKRLTGKGTPLDMPVHMTVSPDSLSYELADVQQRAKWSAVSELFLAKGYWIFLVQSSPWFAPKRLFSDEGAERAFLRDALSNMTDAARARSPDAVTFAQAGNP